MSSKEKLKTWLTDIRFWVFFFFIIRLVGITNPPLETGHNWRQSLTCMIARNFYEDRANILYPAIDYAGSHSGIIGSEFPFYNYLIYLVSVIFDYTHWYGRLINLIVSSLGIYFFYLLVRNLTNKKIAFNSAIIFLSSIWFAFSRKTMPDTFSISLVIIGLYYGYTYIVSGLKLKLLLFFLLTTLGVLCKIPALSLISVLCVLFFMKSVPIQRKIPIGILTLVCIGIISLWYFYWVPHLVSRFNNQLYFPRDFLVGLKEIIPLTGDFSKNFYFNALQSYIAFLFCLVGVFITFSGNNTYLKLGVLIVSGVFFLFILKTGIVFPLHNYYVIPIVPLMALMAGAGLEKVKDRYQYILLSLIMLEGIFNQQHDFFLKKSELYKMEVEELTATNTKNDDLIVINGGQSPQEIYLAHRKGWTVSNEKIDSASLHLYKDAGASFLIINRRTYPGQINYLPLIANGSDYSLYRLKD